MTHFARGSRGLLAAAVALCAAVGLGAPAAFGQGDPSPTATMSAVRASGHTVDFVLSVSGQPAGERLDPASLDVRIDGTPVSTTATPVDTGDTTAPVREVILTLDVSGSMRGAGIAAAREAAGRYAQNLPPDVKIGLLTFADAPRLLLAPTTDRAELARALARVSAGGDTSLYDGVLAAVATMRGLQPDAQRRLLVLSDGKDTASTHRLSDAIDALRTQHVAADVVAFHIPGDTQVLSRLAASSHGRVLPAAGAGDLAAAFSAAARAFAPRLSVHVTVPSAFAGHTANLVARVRAAGGTVTASRRVVLPGAHRASSVRPETAQTPAHPRPVTLWIALGLVFLAVLSCAMLALFLPGLRRAQQRRRSRLAEVNRYRVVTALDAVGASEARADEATPATTAFTRRVLALVDRSVRARGKRARLLDELERSGMRLRPEEWAAMQLLVVVVVAALGGVLLKSVLAAPAGALLGFLGVRFYIRRRIRKRADAFLQQLPDTLQLLSSALRSGFSLSQGLTSVVREGSEPTSSEFARALTEVRLGADLEDALDGIADRMRCQDLSWVVMAVRISREVGGNLSEVLLTTVSTMRERAELRGQVRVLSAEGRISAKILIGLPFFVAGGLSVINPGYLSPLIHSGLGYALLALGAVLLVLGSLWVSRIVKIEV